MIGLDCAAPELVFEAWRADLPTLASLMSRGIHGRLESCIPAITVPAWSTMMTGLDPGQLGFYGFRNRVDYSYDRIRIANGSSVKHPRVWSILSRVGKRVGVVSVPQTYPVEPVNGELVSCFMTPTKAMDYTHPADLAERIRGWLGEDLLHDVPDFRSENKQRILDDTYRLARQHFEVARRLLVENRYEFFMLVDIGVDRMHHAFWRYMDPQHPKHVPGSPFASAIHDYYVFIDGEIGRLLKLIDDETVVLVVSDHGAKPILGGICINEWLIQAGYLTLEEQPSQPVSLEPAQVDWSRTRAWGEGGYYARISMNVAGREPQGVISPEEYEQERDRLAQLLEEIEGPNGERIGATVFRPEQIYAEVNNIAPDLLVYFGDLNWRSIGTVGSGSVWTSENDTGPDDANHAQHGLFILYDPRRPAGGDVVTGASIYDIAPTILSHFELPISKHGRGRPIDERRIDAASGS